MKFKCKFCKLVWNFKEFDELKKYKKQQCYITRKGVPHDLKPFFNKEDY